MEMVLHLPRLQCDWWSVSRNPGITMQDIIDNPQCFWEFFAVSENPNLTVDILSMYAPIRFKWYSVTSNPGITMQDIMDHPEYPWDPYAICENPNLSIQMILDTPVERWNGRWDVISCNPGITIVDVLLHPELNWNWNYVLANEFTLDKTLYVNNAVGSVLLMTLFDTHEWAPLTDSDCSLLVEDILYNCYLVSCILPFV